MSDGLLDFVGRMTPVARERTTWADGAIRLQVSVYLTAEVPPLDYVTSVRAVLFSPAGCAVLHNADGVHVLPAGRRERNESIQATLYREVLEETGCTVQSSQLYALLHFRHETPKPLNYAYPYPDFGHLVFAARTGAPRTFSGDPDGYEQRVEFVLPPALDRIEVPAYQRCLVAAALEVLG